MFALKIFRKKSCLKIALALTIWLSVIELSHKSLAQNNTIIDPQLPTSLAACIPNQPPGLIVKTELVSQTQIDSKTYYFFYAFDEPNSPYPSNLIISLEANRCYLEHFNPNSDPIPLAESIGQQAARNLTLGRYQGEIEKIGFQGLQNRVNSWAKNGQGYTLWDEEEWALRQLGINIPAVLLNPN